MNAKSKERGILMHARSVNGILAGRKTQTRRIVKLKDPETSVVRCDDGRFMASVPPVFTRELKSPYGQPGDRLWVRETFYCDHSPPMTEADRVGDWREQYMFYRADAPNGRIEELMPEADELDTFRWTPSLHMPRWASRITLEITDVRVERVQDISVEGIKAEGVHDPLDIGLAPYRAEWKRLWDDTNGKGAWDRNDWVWVVEFKVVSP